MTGALSFWMLWGLALFCAGWSAVYLASQHQRWRARPWPARPARAAGGVLLLAGFAALCQVLHVVAAVYVGLTWSMLLLVLMPYLGALVRRPQPAKSGEA